ncbi:MAG: MBOAT family protein [Synechococcales cyanobacterium C42_A2020_086]|jgi:alginate O-acetyltransferase complex protein AlgI|nr:MBOAT family protein [Synechococcales cyanobacterium C42_A2020_086]
MTLLSITYGLFLLSTLGIYWSLERSSRRLWILLIASLVFYSSLQIQYVPLLLVISLITFYVGLALGAPMDWRTDDREWAFAQQDWHRRRLMLLWVGIGCNLLLLLGFKYLPFLLETAGVVLSLPAATEHATWIRDSLIAPLGISFFSFECIAYLVDVYRGAPATHDLLKFFAYKLFFPKLISGPISRFHPLAAQFQSQTAPAPTQIVEGLWLIACGAVKKLLLADHLGTVVNLIYGNVERAGSGDLWLAVLAYGLQLYLDFSGYVDVARGSAMLLGFNLPQNFDFPYFSPNIADFWRRWHMTLGDWLRNYLYFPLGGSRQGLARTCLNLMIVMLLAGIWHGAAWGFVAWGALHGLALVVHRLTAALSNRWTALGYWWQSLPGIVLAWLITQFMVFTTWIFFRLPNLQDSIRVVQRLFGQTADIQFAQKVYVETLQMERLHLFLLIGLLIAGMGGAYTLQRGFKLQLAWMVKILLVPICLFAAWLLAPNETPAYIYFDF